MGKNRKKTAIVLGLTAGLLFVAGGCGKEEAGTAAVQSVSSIMNMGSTDEGSQFAGIVTTGVEKTVKRDSSRKIADTMVKVGDTVKKGDILFVYNNETIQQDIEKAKLELEQLTLSIEEKKKEIKEYENQRNQASQEDQLDYTIQINTANTELREEEYNKTVKEQEIKKLEKNLTNTDVTAPMDGKISKIKAITNNGSSGGEGDSSSETDGGSGKTDYISIQETDNFHVTGSVNESQISSVVKGEPVTIRSRVDETKAWKGIIDKVNVDTAKPTNSEGAMGGETSEGDQDTDALVSKSSNYPFYVALENSDNLMIGQHVYIQLGDTTGLVKRGSGVYLPEYYINDITKDPWVWAESKGGKLEKRSVTLGEMDETDGSYLIKKGLDQKDYIAFPEESLKEGQKCKEYNDDSYIKTKNGDEAESGDYEKLTEDAGLYEDVKIDNSGEDGVISEESGSEEG